MKTLNLYFDFKFTSLSPDAQPISLGIVSDEDGPDNWLIHPKEFEKLNLNKDEYELVNRPVGTGYIKKVILESKSFYAEFSDFDMNRCDDWVKENVVSKLRFQSYHGCYGNINDDKKETSGSLSHIQDELSVWLTQFSDYQIQFICDCGTWDWYWLVQLLDERERFPLTLVIDETKWDTKEIDELVKEWRKAPTVILKQQQLGVQTIGVTQKGLPKLPDNISPVPFDINDLIAIKQGITPLQAFDIDREKLMVIRGGSMADELMGFCAKLNTTRPKHNALWDAKVIKEIYQKLK